MAKEEYDNLKGEAYIELVTMHQSRVYSYILSLVPRFSDADDLIQKTWKTVWEKFDEYERGTDFLSWAIKIANYKMLEFWRADKKHGGIRFNERLIKEIELDARKYAEDPNMYLPHLYDCIKKLNKEDLKLVQLKYYQNLKVKEISARFGKSFSFVYKNLTRIYEVLQVCVRRSMLLEEQL